MVIIIHNKTLQNYQELQNHYLFLKIRIFIITGSKVTLNIFLCIHIVNRWKYITKNDISILGFSSDGQ